MASRLVTGPTGELLPLHVAKDHLRVDHTAEDDLISAQVAAAIGYAEEFNGWSLVTQTREEAFDCFPCGRRVIELSRPPLRSVASISYVDADGLPATLDPASYVVDTASQPGRVGLAYGANWPRCRHQLGAVRIVYEAGFGTPDKVPEMAVAAIKLVLGKLYLHRSDTITGTIVSELGAADALLNLATPRIVRFA
jgi:uncharacterized phiE125 gp8 family phage protein